MKRAEVRFNGHVQNVGFRYTTLQIAKDYVVTGFVRNEPDGSVFMVVEGLQEDVAGFIEAIRERMRDYIHTDQVHWQSATGAWHRFDIG